MDKKKARRFLLYYELVPEVDLTQTASLMKTTATTARPISTTAAFRVEFRPHSPDEDRCLYERPTFRLGRLAILRDCSETTRLSSSFPAPRARGETREEGFLQAGRGSIYLQFAFPPTVWILFSYVNELARRQGNLFRPSRFVLGNYGCNY